MLKVTYIIMIMYYATPMTPLYNATYLFPLSRAVNSNRLLFDPSKVEIDQYLTVVNIHDVTDTLGRQDSSYCERTS